MRPASF
jgi:allantoinase